jgi:hypothetical protein
MRAFTLLQKSLGNALNSVHCFRLTTLWFAVEALLTGDRLTLTWLGRSGRSEASGKHRVKRVCRFLGNQRMHGNLITVYRAAAHFALRSTPQPLILVDWTSVGTKLANHALVATTPIGGRSVILYAEVHPEKLLGTAKVEKAFLMRLKAVLPASCRPIVVTDAGFRTPWFDAVTKLNWDCVGRLSANVLLSSRGSWLKCVQFWPRARTEALDLGTRSVTKSKARLLRCVLIKAKRGVKRSKPAKRCATKQLRDCSVGEKSKPRSTERYRLKSPEPWFLVSSLQNCKAKRIVHIFKTRMQIEETFRDLKSQRFGWSFDESRTLDPKRIETLILVAALAALVTLLAGIAAEGQDLARHYQANTQRKRRVFSLMFLGRLLIRRAEVGLSSDAILAAKSGLQALIASYGGLE